LPRLCVARGWLEASIFLNITSQAALFGSDVPSQRAQALPVRDYRLSRVGRIFVSLGALLVPPCGFGFPALVCFTHIRRIRARYHRFSAFRHIADLIVHVCESVLRARRDSGLGSFDEGEAFDRSFLACPVGNLRCALCLRVHEFARHAPVAPSRRPVEVFNPVAVNVAYADKGGGTVTKRLVALYLSPHLVCSRKRPIRPGAPTLVNVGRSL